MKISTKKRVGILRGGTDEYYRVSLERGAELLREISENLSEKYKPIDILIDKGGTWHISGLPVIPASLINKVDVVWNSSHPSFSETLKNIGMPNTGPGIFPHLLKNSREMLEEHMKGIEINMPKSFALPLYQKDFDGSVHEYAVKAARKVFDKFPSPWIVRSLTPDSATAVHVTKTFVELTSAIEDVAMHKRSILIEELIVGKAVAVHSVSGFRGEEIYNMPLLETSEVFSKKEKEDLSILARNIYNHVGAKEYLKSNFVISPQKGIFLTSIELTPNFKDGSHFCKSCEGMGAEMHHIIEHILNKIYQ